MLFVLSFKQSIWVADSSIEETVDRSLVLSTASYQRTADNIFRRLRVFQIMDHCRQMKWTVDSWYCVSVL